MNKMRLVVIQRECNCRTHVMEARHTSLGPNCSLCPQYGMLCRQQNVGTAYGWAGGACGCLISYTVSFRSREM